MAVRSKLLTGTIILVLGGAALVGCAAQAEPEQTFTSGEALTNNPQGDALYRCATERGWDVEQDEFGATVSKGLPPEQADLYNEDMAECMTQVSEQFAIARDDLPSLYRAELRTAECLEGLGYGGGTAPSEQAFIDSWGAGGAWAAYDDAYEQIGESDWARVNELCPQPLQTWNGKSFDE